MQASEITTESWRDCLRAALLILREAEQRGFGRPAFAMGGGTVLMLRFQHRLSRDIDLFIDDVQWIGILTPRLNDYTAALAADYLEQANSLKLILPQGDIDLIAASAVLRDELREELDFEGEVVRLESTAEIIAKKLLFRAASLRPRDLFDLATAIELDPPSAARAVAAAAAQRAVLLRRIAELSNLPPNGSEILARPASAAVREGMAARASAFIARHAGEG